MNLNKFFTELKRRNVYKVAVTYSIAAWLLAQIAALVTDTFGAPDWIMRMIFLLLMIGFPIALILAWIYELSPQGMIRTDSKDAEENPYSNKKKKPFTSNIFIGVLILIIIGQFIFTRFFYNDYLYPDDTEKSIAVLPFEYMSANKDNEWFGDGVTEDILTHLSKVKELNVISRTSVKQYKESDKTIPQIAKELGVSYIVEGSVRLLDNKLVINAQLISANDKHMWAESYNDKLDNAFEVQRTVSREIVKQLQINLGPVEEEALNKSLTDNQNAYKLYLKGRDLSDIELPVTIQQSVEALKQAIIIDPNFASAYAELANSNFLLSQYAGKPIDETITESRSLAEKALLIDPDNARAYGVLGVLNLERGNYEEARINYEKSLLLNPNDARVRHHYALYFWFKPVPDYKRILDEMNKAQKLSPFSYLVIQAKIASLIFNSKYEEAEDLLNEKKFIYHPDHFLFLSSISKSTLNKDWAITINMYVNALKKEPNNAFNHMTLAYFYHSVFNDKENMLTEAKKSYDLNKFIGARAYGFAALYNEQYSVLQELFQDKDFLNSIFKADLNYLRANYYFKLGDFNKSLDMMNLLSSKEIYNILYEDSYSVLKLACYVGLKDQEKANEIMRTEIKTNTHKALAYAVLKEKDSMYHYLKGVDVITAYRINSYFSLQPYKQEDRYKEFLSKNFLPVTN